MDSGSLPNGSASAALNGDAHGELAQVLQALQAIYAPDSTNDTRRQASEYLEQAKRHPEAPSHGYTLALDKSQPAQLRHYGLSLLEFSIKYKWEDFSDEQGNALRGYVVQLAQNAAEQDPPYLRNKIAQLWTEIAKRSWGAEWINMDEQLVGLWQTSLHHQAIVLYVLESLSEEIFNREDPTAGLRGSDLGRACVEIFTPAAVLVEHLPSRDKNLHVRHGDQGWLKRLCDNLSWCLSQDYRNNERIQYNAAKSMSALRAAMPWVIPKAIAAVQLIEHVCKALAIPVIALQQGSIEVLHAIYTRHHAFRDDEFVELVCPMFTPGSVQLLREVYQWALSDLNMNDLDEQKYTLCKKVSELAADLGNYIEQKPRLFPADSDFAGIFGLLYDILENPSLVVSIPVLHCWTRLLRSREVRESPVVAQLIGQLLHICCTRLVRYEQFPEESEDPTILFLNEDIDTIPEKHAFLGNYRRFCTDIVEVLVRRTPKDAMEHILSQATNTFHNLYNGQPAFEAQRFSKSSQTVLLVDAQVTVIDAALKGYLKWLSTHGDKPDEENRQREAMEDLFEEWCRQLLQGSFEDPEISRKVVQLLATFSTKALPDRPSFALSLLEYLFNVMTLPRTADFAQYADAVKELERVCGGELQKLAIMFPDDFMAVYDDLDRKINELTSTRPTDDRQQMAFSALLFIIVHRSRNIEETTRQNRMRQTIDQVKYAWQNEAFTKSLSSFENFCDLLSMAQLPEFLSTHNFQRVQDWSAEPLDSQGQALQAAIVNRPQHLPLRLTKSLVAASVEKVREGSSTYETAALLWSEAIPIILPNILQLISHAQAFNNIDNKWSHLPPELQVVMQRVLTDRFWQAGISTESRDDFFARVSGSKSTYEGFASTVRGTVRQVRESAYFILYSLTRFRDFFYGINDLPGPLSQALFANAHALSAHHLSVLLSVASHLIEACPPHMRGHFLPPMVEGLFRELSNKITSEWEAINRQIQQSGENDNLTNEMKTESILRQLTYSAVTFVSVLLDPNVDNKGDQQTEASMRAFILNTPSVLEPIVTFSNAVIRVRDTRSVVNMIRILRTVLPHFRQESVIRDYFCQEVFKSAITSLHEPYFVDAQKELATLIATIISLDEGVTKGILLTLPGIGDPARVDRKLDRLRNSNKHDDKLHRSVVLDLLANVRGQSIHEQGRIQRAPARNKKVQDQYMSVDEQPAIIRGTSPGLDGVAGMFGES